MKIIIAETAGFCFGVERAVKLCRDTAEKYGKCKTLGPIIHNEDVVNELKKSGVIPVQSIEDITEGDNVIIRSHGAGKSIYDKLNDLQVNVIDATCPFVKKIHNFALKATQEGRTVIVIGQKNHPEVEAICGWCDNFEVFADADELEKWLKTANNFEIPVTLVSQTTQKRENFKKCAEILKKLCTNQKIFDTICDATSLRQKEAAELAAQCTYAIVIGGKASANSYALYKTCTDHCKHVKLVQRADELDTSEFDSDEVICITAGASTPTWIIKEVHQKMSEEIKEVVTEIEEVAEKAADTDATEAVLDMEAMYENYINTPNSGDVVTGIVEKITPTEVSVSLGSKFASYIPISELSDDPNAKPEDIVKVGDEVSCYVRRVNEVEGTITLSKKRYDQTRIWDVLEELRDSKEVVEGKVIEENKGGLVVLVKSARVFVPSSLTGVAKNVPLSTMLNQQVKLRITEVDRVSRKKRVIGSIKAVASEERKARAEAIWNEIEEGKKYTGTVKSLTSYGAFVDIGGIDGMIHVSELSWSRISAPSDVLKVGDEVDVYVISFDKEKRKISLGYKLESDNPWVKFTTNYAVDSIATVKIVKLMPFGAFARIIDGVDGLIHISQIADRRIGTPAEVLTEGQEVEAKITAIDEEKHKVSLSIRALLDDAKAEAAPAEEAEAVEEAPVEE